MCKAPEILSFDAWVKGGACSTTSCRYLSFNCEMMVRTMITVVGSNTHLVKGDLVIPGEILGLINGILKSMTVLTF